MIQYIDNNIMEKKLAEFKKNSDFFIGSTFLLMIAIVIAGLIFG
jgi:hypothetical protein